MLLTNKLTVIIFCVFISTAVSSETIVSKSPLMGWASWNHFGVKISESIIKGYVLIQSNFHRE